MNTDSNFRVKAQMKALLCSIFAATLFAIGTAFGDPASLRIPEQDSIKVGALRSSGMKLLSPLTDSGGGAARLKFEGTEVILQHGELSVGPLPVSTGGMKMDAKDLTPATKYYPPEPRVQDSTPLAALSLDVGSHTEGALSNDRMEELVPTLASAFALPESELRAYFEHAKGMPKMTKPLTLEGTAGKALVMLTISAHEGELPFSLHIYFRWKKMGAYVRFKSDQQDGGGQPATRSKSK